MPVIRPVAEPMVAMEGLLLLQVPPGVASCAVIVSPTQIDVAGAVIGAGKGLTVTVAVTMQVAR